MGWFEKICRNTGLMIHHVVHPPKDDAPPATNEAVSKKEVSRKVEEKQVSPTMTLRRTTIEEIEIKKPDQEPG